MVSEKLYFITKRVIDIGVSLLFFLVGAIPLILIGMIIRSNSKGPAIHWSKRIGKNNKIFLMAKFRTMKIETPQVATHLMSKPDMYLTNIGSFLRKYSIDELPQFYNVLKGDMSLVGPRPALFNQDDLKALRTSKGVFNLQPGLTGWAQVCGRDEISIPDKVSLDEYYLHYKSIWFDIKIIILTLYNVVKAKDVHH
jgi:O-antigen biosynthesis protein WbqP